MLRSFFVPKISSTMTRTMTQCPAHAEPMKLSSCGGRALFLRDHSRERIRAADDVDVQMIHVLPADPPRVHDGAEAVRRALLARERAAIAIILPEHGGMLGPAVGERVDVLSWG